jgi:hypothetical protein
MRNCMEVNLVYLYAMKSLFSVAVLFYTLAMTGSAQHRTGSYAGGLKVIGTDIDLGGQEQALNMQFTIFNKPHFSRCNFIVPAMGYVVVQTDSLNNEEVSYFEAMGKKIAMRSKPKGTTTAVQGPSQFAFERGGFVLAEGDTIIAQHACKRAIWHETGHPENNLAVWYAVSVPCALKERYIGLPGMPMYFVFYQDHLTVRYEITQVSDEAPEASYFEPLPDHEWMEAAEPTD